VRIQTPEEARAAQAEADQSPEHNVQFQHEEAGAQEAAAARAAAPVTGTSGGFARVGRNEPCPCGSGKKFKHCHGAIS
ncbi:MAG: SEC-C metal-binding domain-containing protein, partial [Pigmentiphaga sp.]